MKERALQPIWNGSKSTKFRTLVLNKVKHKSDAVSINDFTARKQSFRQGNSDSYDSFCSEGGEVKGGCAVKGRGCGEGDVVNGWR